MLSKLLRAKTPNVIRSARGGPDNTRSIAKNRLNAALSRDRYDLLGPVRSGRRDSLERDLYAAISSHLEVDSEFHELEIRRLNDSFYLVASVRIQAMLPWAPAG
ncbi:MAG: cell division topological specificity factor MinE [Chloroflexota bacterium]|nr:cell division topological specificity factor MinE [Chloroflexota bacterium]